MPATRTASGGTCMITRAASLRARIVTANARVPGCGARSGITRATDSARSQSSSRNAGP